MVCKRTVFNQTRMRHWYLLLTFTYRASKYSVRRMPPAQREKQTNQVIKLHRTAHRLIQVAASRPILRILNPHIYSDLGGLIQELLKISGR